MVSPSLERRGAVNQTGQSQVWESGDRTATSTAATATTATQQTPTNIQQNSSRSSNNTQAMLGAQSSHESARSERKYNIKKTKLTTQCNLRKSRAGQAYEAQFCNCGAVSARPSSLDAPIVSRYRPALSLGTCFVNKSAGLSVPRTLKQWQVTMA